MGGWHNAEDETGAKREDEDTLNFLVEESLFMLNAANTSAQNLIEIIDSCKTVEINVVYWTAVVRIYTTSACLPQNVARVRILDPASFVG